MWHESNSILNVVLFQKQLQAFVFKFIGIIYNNAPFGPLFFARVLRSGNRFETLLHFIRNALRNPKSNYSNRNTFEFQLRFGPTQPLHETRPLNKLNLMKESVSIQTLILHDVPHIRNADSEIFISVIFNMCQNEYYGNVESSTEKKRKELPIKLPQWNILTSTNENKQISTD